MKSNQLLSGLPLLLFASDASAERDPGVQFLARCRKSPKPWFAFSPEAEGGFVTSTKTLIICAIAPKLNRTLWCAPKDTT